MFEGLFAPWHLLILLLLLVGGLCVGVLVLAIIGLVFLIRRSSAPPDSED